MNKVKKETGVTGVRPRNYNINKISPIIYKKMNCSTLGFINKYKTIEINRTI